MLRRILFCFSIFCLSSFGMSLGAAAAQGESAEIRDSARMMARVDHSLQNKDLKGYCAATVGAQGYEGYVERACQYGVKLKVKTSLDCTPDKISAEVAADRKKCNAMSGSEFNEVILRHPERRAEWVKSVNSKGVDAEKLLQEERAKLK